MLTLVLGRALTGKTRWATDDFARRAENGEKNLYYIVPEQYSHDAERQLLKTCSDALSLHGEVLSFSRLASRVFAETGVPASKTLDRGGRILYMNRAVDAVTDKLAMYGGSERKANFLEMLAEAASEFKSACVTPDDLWRASRSAPSPLREKLRDLSLITGAYDSFFGDDTADPDDRLGHLAQVLTKSTMFCSGRVYFDGFTDFTAQESAVVETLIGMGVDMTVCLTCDGTDGTEEHFEPSRKTALRLLRASSECGVPSEVIEKTAQSVRADQLRYIERNLFAARDGAYGGPRGAVELYRADTPAMECEYAAARVLALVRDGYRWRDIAVAMCDFPSYGRMAEDIFSKYGIPVFVGQKTEVTQKPPLALIDGALGLITGRWDCESVFRYLKTGMTGLAREDCDDLENYALLWNLKGAIWTRDEDWTLPTSGYEPDHGGDGQARLARLNAVRRDAVGPVVHLRDALSAARTYGGKLRALYRFTEEIGLPGRLAQKEAALRKSGEIQLADEYRQLWDVLVRAFDQFYEILGDVTGSNAEFARLWKLLTSQYDIASIPVALDRVSLGELSRQRRRNLKCLIVIGATDDVMPKTGGGGSLLSDGERREAQKYGIRLPGGAEERLYRELGAVYSTLTLPSDKLVVSWYAGGSGGEKRPSFVVRRLSEMFGITEENDVAADFRVNARGPCFELAASYLAHGGSTAAAAAAHWFREEPQTDEKLRRIAEAADLSRGRLSADKASRLYGSALVMSASRVDTFYACRFLYFLQYGLAAKPRRPAGFDAPTAGTFMHYVLENVTREIKESGGFAGIDDETCRHLTEKYADRYAEDVLQSFADKSSRFIYLFNRLKKDAAFIAIDMVGELRDSDFAPLDFELAFSDDGDIPPRVIDGEETRLKIKGFIDRLDGWEHDGRLYVRVVDYKTGRKKFSLSDVCYGMNMQMLIYLFALRENGGGRYGKEIVPAGVLYAPAREEILQAPRNADDAELELQRAKKLRRSGLLLGEQSVVNAMEHAGEKKYLPVKTAKDGALSGDGLAWAGQFDDLSKYIDRMLLKIARSVRGGSIEARPFYKNRSETACLYCDYRSVCHFSEKDGDTRRYLKKLTNEESWRKIRGEADA